MKSPFTLLYAAAEILAGASLVAMLLLILTGVVFRLVGRQLAGSDDLSSYCLVAVFFLGLAPTYRRGEHIRVGMLINRLNGKVRRLTEFVLVGIAGVGTAWATWWLARTVYDSWRFHDMAQGLIAVPLWVPQSAMALGAFILLVALVEDFVRGLGGAAPSHAAYAEVDSLDVPAFER